MEEHESMPNFRVVKVVETVVTVYTVRGDLTQHEAEDVVEHYHLGTESENPKLRNLRQSVEKISSTSSAKTHTQYSLKNERPIRK